MLPGLWINIRLSQLRISETVLRRRTRWLDLATSVKTVSLPQHKSALFAGRSKDRAREAIKSCIIVCFLSRITAHFQKLLNNLTPREVYLNLVSVSALRKALRENICRLPGTVTISDTNHSSSRPSISSANRAKDPFPLSPITSASSALTHRHQRRRNLIHFFSRPIRS